MTYLAAAPDLTNISIANAGIVAVLGYAVVFFGLILLMLVVTAMARPLRLRMPRQRPLLPLLPQPRLLPWSLLPQPPTLSALPLPAPQAS